MRHVRFWANSDDKRTAGDRREAVAYIGSDAMSAPTLVANFAPRSINIVEVSVADILNGGELWHQDAPCR